MYCEPIVVQVQQQKESWLQVEGEAAQFFLFAQFVKTKRLGRQAEEMERLYQEVLRDHGKRKKA